jgi:hypothetical protein
MRSSYSRAVDAVRHHDPDGSKSRAIVAHISDTSNPARPENNKNPLDVKPYDVIVIEHVLDNTRREAFLVLDVHRGWDNRLHLGLGGCDSHLKVQCFTMTVEDNGVNAIFHVMSAAKWNNYQGIDQSVRVVNILNGPAPTPGMFI